MAAVVRDEDRLRLDRLARERFGPPGSVHEEHDEFLRRLERERFQTPAEKLEGKS